VLPSNLEGWPGLLTGIAAVVTALGGGAWWSARRESQKPKIEDDPVLGALAETRRNLAAVVSEDRLARKETDAKIDEANERLERIERQQAILLDRGKR